MDKKQVLTTSIAVVATGLTLGSLYHALHSPLFDLQVIEVTQDTVDPSAAPLLANSSIEEQVEAYSKDVNLLKLNLQQVEKEISSYEWVDRVELRKVLPSTLSVHVTYRKPIALVQTPEKEPEDGRSGKEVSPNKTHTNTQLKYMDRESHLFGLLDHSLDLDLPLVTGKLSAPTLKWIPQFLSQWSHHPISNKLQLGSLDFIDANTMVTTASILRSQASQERRIILDFNNQLTQNLNPHFDRLNQVIEYLELHSIPFRRVVLSGDKKIFVKTDQRS